VIGDGLKTGFLMPYLATPILDDIDLQMQPAGHFDRATTEGDFRRHPG